MSVPQYTTPTFTLTFTKEDLDLTQARNVYVTFRSGQYILTKTDTDLSIEAKSIGVHLTQKETSYFRDGSIDIQANWTTPGGGRIASEIVQYQITEQLLKKVIE